MYAVALIVTSVGVPDFNSFVTFDLPQKWKDIEQEIEESKKNMERELEKQRKAYEESSKERPFLKMIDRYIPEHRKITDEKELIYDISSKYLNMKTRMGQDEFIRIFNDSMSFLTGKADFKRVQRGEISHEDYMADVERYVDSTYQNIYQTDKEALMGKLKNALLDYYVLQDAINDPNISDIRVISPTKIRVKVKGQRMTSNLTFINGMDYIRFVEAVALRNGSDLSAGNAIQNFTDTVTDPNYILRFDITTPYVNCTPFPYLSIRKTPKQKRSLKTLINWGVLTENQAAFLIDAIRNGRGIAFGGQGGSGKTTVYNALIDYIPYSASCLIAQENSELFSRSHPELMTMKTVENTSKNKKSYTYDLADESRNALLMDLDYFGIGEIKGKEALYFMNAANAGTKTLCTLHTWDAQSIIPKLAQYIKMESDYSMNEVMEILSAGVQYVVYLKNFSVHEILEVIGWDPDEKRVLYRVIDREDSR